MVSRCDKCGQLVPPGRTRCSYCDIIRPLRFWVERGSGR